MVLNNYAQINESGLCFAELSTSGEIDDPSMIAISPGDRRIGQRWTGTEWEIVPPSKKETAIVGLMAIDAETGMSRTLREAIISIGKKVAADVAFLESKETAAAALRVKAK